MGYSTVTSPPLVGYDLALRASNLQERRELMATAGIAGPAAFPPEVSAGGLAAVDAWRLHKLAGLLAAQLLDDSELDPAVLVRLEAEIECDLAAHRRWELNPELLGDDARRLLMAAHAAWLPTYQAAMADFDREEASLAGVSWRRADVYDRHFARVCEPFLLHLHNCLGAVIAAANAESGRPLFSGDILDGVERHFLERFELALAWALEADTNVYCARLGIDMALDDTEQYLTYLQHTFADQAARHRFFLHFPLLGRWLATVCTLLRDHACEVIGRLAADRGELEQVLFGGAAITFRGIEFGLGDNHAGGRSVARILVDLPGGERRQFIYKPHSLAADAGMQVLLARLREAGALASAPCRVIARPDYGYVEYIPDGSNDSANREEAAGIYRELGGYLAIFHVLGGGDLHFENIRVANGHAFVCDVETALGVRPGGEGQPIGTVLDSVYATGLLEWPRAGGPAGSDEVRISGYGGGESYVLPMPVPRINRRMSLAVGVRHETGVRVESQAANRVFLQGRLVLPEEFKDDLVAGFARVHRWFEAHQAEAGAVVRGGFAGAPIRFVNWATQVYAQLLISLRHPKCLMDPLEADLTINKLVKHRRRWDADGRLAARERDALWRLDVPLFTAEATSSQLRSDRGELVGHTLSAPPLADSLARIDRLSADNRTTQERYLVASLEAGNLHSPAFIASALDYATKVGLRLIDLLREPTDGAPWLSYQLTPTGPGDAPIAADLYNGSAGVALFLAYLDAVAPNPDFRGAARRALDHASANAPRNRLGAFNGVMGVVYVLVHLAQLWEDSRLLARAAALARAADPLVASDRAFDVLSGVAGAIPVSVALAAATADTEALERAQRCAEHLLAHAVRTEGAWSWPLADEKDGLANFTGFAHGAGGIGWALISLGCVTGNQDYIDAGKLGFAYERLHFDPDQQDWYDLRTSMVGRARGRRHFANVWCNGSAGIGLSRIASWALLGKSDEDLLKEASIALAATLRTFHQVSNDTLCHGRSGNAELFLRFALLNDAPAFQLEANVQAQTQWQDIERDGRLARGGETSGIFPGLMIGLSGLGLHFLRLACPDRVPSPLLLDPPRPMP